MIFVREPTKIHYVKEISKKINLAPSSVKLHLKTLLEDNIIIRKKGERAVGFVSNRDNNKFLFYKKIGNLISLIESNLIDHIVKTIYPSTIIVYGSYIRGEDIENSDIDLFIISKIKKNILLEKFEKKLNRKLHIMIQKDFKKLPSSLKKEIINGHIIYGYLDIN